MRRLIRRVRCRLGFHRWQLLLAAPGWHKGDDYDKGIWCIFCGARHPCEPGSVTP